MTTPMDAKKPVMTAPETRNRLVGGAALLGIGLLVLASQVLRDEAIARYVPLALGAIFLVAGVLTRHGGLLVPGGILTRLGVGVGIVAQPLAATSELTTGAVVLLSLGGGFVLVTVSCLLVCRELTWWPLIPGGILALTGGQMLAGDAGTRGLELLSRVRFARLGPALLGGKGPQEALLPLAAPLR